MAFGISEGRGTQLRKGTVFEQLYALHLSTIGPYPLKTGIVFCTLIPSRPLCFIMKMKQNVVGVRTLPMGTSD
jgi:hypothetical protein